MHKPLLLVSITFLWQLVASAENGTAHSVLVPVSDEGWTNRLIRRWTPGDYLRLADKEHFVWSSPSDSGDNIFVNMTMSTGEEELIISMERFADQLKDVSCSQDMMMSFKSKESYSSAVASWDWVNFNENRTFIMIANYPGCGVADSRQPWIVSNAAYDADNLAVHLNASEKTWKEVAHTYSLDFGRFNPPTSSKSRRQFNGDKQISLDLGATLPVDLSGGFGGSSNSLSVACNACGTQGKIILDGHIESSWFQITDFTLTAKPVGLQADLNLALTVTNDNLDYAWKPEPITFFTIPLGGFSIPELITLGPNLAIGGGLALSGAKGSATISSTITAVIPDWSIAQVQLAGSKGATFSGWEPQFAAGPLHVHAQVVATLEVFAQAKLGIGVTVLGQGVDLSLVFKIPDVVVTAKPVFGVACGDEKKADVGVNLSASIGANLGLKAATHVDGVETDFVDIPMFSLGAKYAPPWASVCIPL